MKIAANTAGIAQGAKQTAKQLEGIQKSATQAASAMRTMVGIKVAEILAKGFSSAASAISGFVSNIRTTIDETAKLAARTGIAVEALQGFQVAAGLSGVGNLDTAVQKLTITIGDAAAGNKTAQDALAKLGLSYQDLASLSPEDQFRAISAAIAELPTHAERAAAAADLFGRSGVELLPLFEANLAAIEERAQRLGIVLSADQTAAIEEMNDALSLVYQTFEGIIGQVTANLAPVVTELSEMFLGMVEGYEGVNTTGGTAIADSITDALFDGAEYIAGILDYAVAAFNEFGGVLEVASGVFEFVANTFVAVTETLRVVFNVFEMIGNALMIGLGKILQGLGSWVDSDLEQAGKEMVSIYSGAFAQNAAEAGDAAAHAFNAVAGDRNFGRESESSQGMFGSAVGGARERYNSSRSPEAQAAREEKRRKEQEARDAAQKEAERARKAEEEAKRQAEAQKKYDEELAKRSEELATKEFEYATKNAEDLAAVNQKALKATDIRSGGIDQVLAMATGREDPAVAESRKQLRELQAMRMELAALKALPVEITGAA